MLCCGENLFISTAGSEVKKACEFLISHQMKDGGWGEDFKVLYTSTYYVHYSPILLHTLDMYHIVDIRLTVYTCEMYMYAMIGM